MQIRRKKRKQVVLQRVLTIYVLAQTYCGPGKEMVVVVVAGVRHVVWGGRGVVWLLELIKEHTSTRGSYTACVAVHS